MLKAVALDDETMALEVIKKLSLKVPFIELTAVFTDAFEALAFLQQNTIDLLFLDIRMPDISGVDFLLSVSNPPMVVFTTAHSEHAVQSFELNAVDYLLKPFSLPRFLKACNKAHQLYKLHQLEITGNALPAIFIKSGYEKFRLPLEDVLYIESSGNYVHFITAHQKLASRMTMAEAFALLPPGAFLRVHRFYIVAKNKIAKMDRESIWIEQKQLPIGEGYFSEIEKAMK